MNKITRIITIILFAVVCLAACSACGDDDDYDVLRAVPLDAGVIVTTTDIHNLCASLDFDNQVWAQMRRTSQLWSAGIALYTLDTLIKKNNFLRMALQGRNVAVSFHNDGANNVSALISVEMDGKSSAQLLDRIQLHCKANGLVFKDNKYDKGIIYSVSNPRTKNGITLWLARQDGFLVGSTSKLTTEQAIRHIAEHEDNIANNRSLNQLLKDAGSDVSAILLFNYTKLCAMFGSNMSKKLGKASKLAGWSVLDISLRNKNAVSSSGYTNCVNVDNILSIVSSQKPVANDIAKYLPSKTISFVSLGISDMHLFRNDYGNYLKASNKYADYDRNDHQINKAYDIKIADILYQNIGSRITDFSCTYSLAGRKNDHYVVAELNNPEEFAKQMLSICKKFRQNNKIADKNGIKTIRTSVGKTYTVYQFPIKHLFNSYFGGLFDTESNYFMMYGDNAVFSTSAQALYDYANSIDNDKVLINNAIYENFEDYITSESNLYMYTDISYSQEGASKLIDLRDNDERAKLFSTLQYIRSAAVQYSYDKENRFFTNAAIVYNNMVEDDRYVSWLAPTDTTIAMKPQFVINHGNKQKEVILQDETNKLYLFDKSGHEQWRKQIGEPITSQIFQIDYYGNGKLQYIFATENFLHLIDRNGNYLDNYPVPLPAKVSTEISVFDYDGSHDYRIFVPCSDKRLYLYTKEGTPLDSWTPLPTNEPILTPVQHFRCGENDFLVCADNLKTYILNRRGEVRINVSNTFPKARNSIYYVEKPDSPDMRFITTNSSGEVKYIYSDGSCKSKKFNSFTANHYFVLKDIDNDGKNEYIFTDNEVLYVYKEDGSEVFFYAADAPLGRPNIFKFSDKDVRIGVTCKSLRQVYLFDNKGSICRGFPMQGTTEFTIQIFDHPDKYSLIVGNADNYLYNYLIR